MTTHNHSIDSMRKIYDHVWHWIVKQTYEITDSPINSTNTNRKTKSTTIENSQQTKSCQNMKCIVSPKQIINSTTKRMTPDYSDMERNNIYAETRSKLKPNSSSSVLPPTFVNGTNHYMPILQQRRPPNTSNHNDNNVRNLNSTSSSSMSSFSTATCSSRSTTPSNSYRHDTTSIMTRSADASSSCGLIIQTKNGTNNTKSKSTYDIDTSTMDRSRTQTKDNLNNNSKCLNMITNGNFVPLQSVKEDECLEVDNDTNKIRLQSNALLPREPITSFSVIKYPKEQKFKQERPQKQIIEQNTSNLSKSGLPIHHQTMYGDAVVISRSIMDRNNQRCLQNHCSTSFRPNRSIVQHNGKQFIVEFTQRIEQRFIQFMDKKTNRMRFFDVIDCIPSTIVRSYGSKSQSLSQNSTSRPNHRSDQCLARQQIPNYRSQTVIPLSFIDKRSFSKYSDACMTH
ncbi:unnamed protein product [Rotaria sp. Silwood1]|nr:unnamed protein product [Rotaria sp. Silwood1]